MGFVRLLNLKNICSSLIIDLTAVIINIFLHIYFLNKKSFKNIYIFFLANLCLYNKCYGFTYAYLNFITYELINTKIDY